MPAAHGQLVVLDAWPIIEHYEGNDPASAEIDTLVARHGPRPIMSATTFTEVYYTLANRHDASSAERESHELLRLVSVEPVDTPTAAVAARIKHTYRMSLGDAFAAAAAIRHGAELWTGDPELLCPDRV
ncbi:MAG: type II toxin-antitoxin system VapC family toxin [Caldilineaceae bacterium SB0668_bin_21]|nr:type II toxin-antitoxin system VapC family toxin [Caldilineaceae bacterium SB0668_bin_21]